MNVHLPCVLQKYQEIKITEEHQPIYLRYKVFGMHTRPFGRAFTVTAFFIIRVIYVVCLVYAQAYCEFLMMQFERLVYDFHDNDNIESLFIRDPDFF